MFRLKYRYCKARMSAYLNGELSLRSRRRMARYIDECPDCYAEYTRQRELVNDLKGYVPAMGRPQSGQLDRMWANIQSQIGASVNGHSQNTRKPISAGLVTLIVTLLLVLLPWAVSNTPETVAVPSQPAPRTTNIIYDATDPAARNVPLVITAVALMTSDQGNATQPIDLRNTPVPGTHTVQR